MAQDDSREADEPSGSDDQALESGGPIAIATTDPEVEAAAGQPRGANMDPDSTVAIETTHAHEPSPLYLSGVRAVASHDRGAQEGADPARNPSQQADKGQAERKTGGGNPGHGTKGQVEPAANRDGQGRDGGNRKGGPKDQDQHSDDSHADDDGRDDRRDQKRSAPPSMMKSLLITAGIALVAGVIGAAGYSYMVGSKSEQSSSDQSDSKGGSSGKGGTSSKGGGDSKKSSSSEKGAGGEKDKESGQDSSSESSNSGSDQAASVAEINDASAQEVDVLKAQIMGLIERVGALTAREDRADHQKNDMPTLLQTLQIEMSEMARKLTALNDLSARVSAHDAQLTNLKEELRKLRERIDSRTSLEGRGLTESLAIVRQTAQPAAPTPISGDENPTIEKGVRLLAQGRYGPARSTFEKLQLIQPSDARVWYFGALAIGLETGDWNDRATDFAEKGAACERAGTPPSAQIDAQLASLAPITGQAWLESFRRRALSNERTP
jgi:phage host-nuclease inhibitor protein Gam